MKQKRVIIPLLLTACFLLFGKYDVQAATTLENQYTNPYYKDVITVPEHTSDVETYSLNQGNVEYTSDLKKKLLFTITVTKESQMNILTA